MVATDGCLYYLNRAAWVKDKDFRPNTGSLVRVRYTGDRTPPSVISHPADQTVTRGRPAHFRVSAAGTPPLRFQWQRDGTPVAGAPAPPHTGAAVADGDTGAECRCVVTNAFGSVTSAGAKLTVRASDVARDAWVSPRPGAYTGPVTVRLRPEEPDTSLHY